MAERTVRSDSVYVRGPVPEKKPAQRILATAGWGIGEFVVACLRALLADPNGFLTQMQQHRPAQRRPGRPPASPR